MTLATRAEALFVSSLQPSDKPGREDVVRAIRSSLHVYGGVRGCAGAFAAEYAEHPDLSAARMRWALSMVACPTLVAASPTAIATTPTAIAA